MVSGIQLIGVIFSLLVSYFSFVNYKRHEFTLREFLGWEIIWVCFLLATLFPQALNIFLPGFGVLRTFDLLSIFGFILVLSITFYTYVTVDRVRKKLEKAIRDLALSHLEEEMDKSKKGKRKPDSQ